MDNVVVKSCAAGYLGASIAAAQTYGAAAAARETAKVVPWTTSQWIVQTSTGPLGFLTTCVAGYISLEYGPSP